MRCCFSDDESPFQGTVVVAEMVELQTALNQKLDSQFALWKLTA